MMLTKEFKYHVNYIYEFYVLINQDIFVSLTLLLWVQQFLGKLVFSFKKEYNNK